MGPVDLHDVAAFRDISAADATQILNRCQTVTCREGEIVFQEGENRRALFVVSEGSVEVVLAVPGLQEAVVSTLGPKSVFGEASFFHDAPHAATVRCKTAATLARLDRSDFDRLLTENCLGAYRLALNAAEILAARLHLTDRWMATLLGEEQEAVAASWRRFRESIGGSFESPRGFMHA